MTERVSQLPPPYISPPIRGLIRVIAKAVIEDYRQEKLTNELTAHENSELRPLQQR